LIARDTGGQTGSPVDGIDDSVDDHAVEDGDGLSAYC